MEQNFIGKNGGELIMNIEKNNATCSICGKGYYMCRSCKDQMRLNSWKLHTDTSEHYKVYQILHGVSIGIYTKSEAKKKFQNVDLADIDTFRPEIKKLVKSILNEKEVKSETNSETQKNNRSEKKNRQV